MSGMSFGDAIWDMGCGCKVAREGWNGKGMFLFRITSWGFETDVEGVDDLDTDYFICMKTANNTLIPWFASQEDIHAEDWEVVQ